MIPNPTELLELTGIETPLIGFYDTPETKPFEPFIKPKHCFFAAYKNWFKGESVCISNKNADYPPSCQGCGYWIGSCLPQWALEKSGSEQEARENFAKGLNRREGFKLNDQLLHQWFDNVKPYMLENSYVVIGPLHDEQYKYLKTITFYVNPDQLSFLLHGAEYKNASINNSSLNFFKRYIFKGLHNCTYGD